MSARIWITSVPAYLAVILRPIGAESCYFSSIKATFVFFPYLVVLKLYSWPDPFGSAEKYISCSSPFFIVKYVRSTAIPFETASFLLSSDSESPDYELPEDEPLEDEPPEDEPADDEPAYDEPTDAELPDADGALTVMSRLLFFMIVIFPVDV